MAQKVAEQVIDVLVDTGVKRIYAVTGDSLNEINDAVRRKGKINWYMSVMKKQELLPPELKPK